MIKRILVLGANGMLGGSILRFLSSTDGYEVLGIVRSIDLRDKLNRRGFKNIEVVANFIHPHNVEQVFDSFRPDYVINCIGIIKQKEPSGSAISSIQINSLLPHQLVKIADIYGSRLVHFSTDCVFDGSAGMYTEDDSPNSHEIYGLTKLLGEVNCPPHLTLRTSIIGHELTGNLSLVDWFLSQNERVKGFSNAVFSGLPTVFIAEFLHLFIFKNKIEGLFNLSVDPINKYDLLMLIKDVYKKDIVIEKCDQLKIDRSLDSSRLRKLTGLKIPTWHLLIEKMKYEYDTYFT